jgi:hypothetical protein
LKSLYENVEILAWISRRKKKRKKKEKEKNVNDALKAYATTYII